MKLGDWISNFCFQWVHGHNLVYNTCWEDPRLDRQALNLGPNDTLAMITSAGCNALDYACLGPKKIYAIDMNHRQNALLELKIAGIRTLEFDDFFAMFGDGAAKNADELYRTALRPELGPRSRRYWDRHIGVFAGRGPRPSFYFFGASGVLAYGINVYINRIAKVRSAMEDFLNAKSLADQQKIYSNQLHEVFWTEFMKWVAGRDLTLSLMGVPRAQRQQVDKTYPGGIAKFIEDSIQAVFTKLPFQDNYFWRVYLTGSYSRECCPEYLKEENFAKLKGGLVDRVETYTGSVLRFLNSGDEKISRFVLLDHMDWLSTHRQPILRHQWQALSDRADEHTRILFRSGGLTVDYVDPIPVRREGVTRPLGEWLKYDRTLASQLHEQDRVHTYGSFYIADLNAA
ncbi:MAG: BtaA family protein [Gemmataceae bacterium]|nr:BtaA family protein [Gemmataceae bacterium]